MEEASTVPVGVVSIPGEKKEARLRVLRQDIPRPDGTMASVFVVLWNERDAGDCTALDRMLSRAILSSSSLLRSEDGTGTKKRFSPDHILEHIARTTNATILREIDMGALARMPRVHAVVAAFYKNELALIGHGAVHAFLFRVEKRKIIPTDLLHLDEKSNSKQATRNFFGEFISGTIRLDDVVIFGANTLLDYLSLEHLGALTTGTVHPEEATEKIAHLVADTGGAVPFGEVVLRHLGAPIPKRVPHRPVQSIEKLLDTQDETKHYLESSVLSFLGRVIEGKQKTKKESESEPKRAKIAVTKNLFTRLPKPRIKLPGQVTHAHHAALQAFVDRFNAFPARAKIVFPLVLLGIVLFTQSVRVVQSRVGTSHARRAFDEQVAVIREKAAAVQANILYGNKEGAQSLLAEVKPLAEALHAPDLSRTQEEETVKSELQKLVATLAHRQVVTGEKKIAVLPADFSPHGALAFGKATGAVLDASRGKIFTFKTGSEAEQLDREILLDERGGPWRSIIMSDDKTAFAIGEKAIARVDLAARASASLDLDPRLTHADAALWNKRLYRLDTNGEILKHDKSGDGFTKGVRWLKDTPVGSTEDIEIDSAIYVLDAQNNVTKFLGGKKQLFALPALDEPLGGIARIRTWPDSDVLALLDPPTGRIVFVTSGGKLITQYEHKELMSSASDFAIDPASHTIFVISGKAAYSFPFELKK